MPKISELPALAKATSEDLIPIVDDAGNITKKVRAADSVPLKGVGLGDINGGSTAGVLKTDASGTVSVATNSVDANGWKVRDFGTFKRYTKRQWTEAGSFTGGQTKYFSFGNLPVGVTYSTDLDIELGVMSITPNASSTTGSNAFTVPIKAHTSTASNTISVVMTNAYNSTTDVGGFAVFITITKDN